MQIRKLLKGLTRSQYEKNNISQNDGEIKNEPVTEKGKEYFQQVPEMKYQVSKIIIGLTTLLLLLLILILHYPSNKEKVDQWEYKVIRFFNSGESREGSEAFKQTEILISESRLNELGEEGWELVSTSLEMETAYPNFGNSSYVTGLQPNVRPQVLICIFKRQLTKKTEE